MYSTVHTDKKENQIFLIYMEIQSGAVAKSYMTYTASSYLRISSYIRKPFLIHDFATAPICISLYMRKILFSFYQCSYLSVSLLVTRPPSAASRVQEASRTVPASGRRTRATSVTVAPGRARPPSATSSQPANERSAEATT
jgi:hypothetical protein